MGLIFVHKEVKMGLEIQSLRLLLIARGFGAAFDRVVTLGRQDLLLTPSQILTTCLQFGVPMEEHEAIQIPLTGERFCEPLFHKLGATTVDSIDATDFEGATIIHDLNRPIPEPLKGSYDVVFDGGTLEHIFDFPTAIRGCLELPKLGGHFIMASPANNQMGHGFYQFSPDLFYRVLSEENGYQLRALFLVPAFSEGKWFKIRDPAVVQARVGHNAAVEQLSICAIARRIKLVPLFLTPPQQSDYRFEWSTRPLKNKEQDRLAFFDRAIASQPSEARAKLKRIVSALVPLRILRWWRAVRLARYCQPPDPRYFEEFPLGRDHR